MAKPTLPTKPITVTLEPSEVELLSELLTAYVGEEDMITIETDDDIEFASDVHIKLQCGPLTRED